jgi:hypothetical protein
MVLSQHGICQRIGEVSDPFAIGSGRFEAAVEHVGSDGGRLPRNDEQGAWEIVRESYLFPPEERKNPRQPAPLTELLHAAIKSGARTMEIPQGMPRNAQEFKDALKDELE